MFYGTENIPQNIPPYLEQMWEIFHGILSAPHKIIMNPNNVMVRSPQCHLNVTYLVVHVVSSSEVSIDVWFFSSQDILHVQFWIVHSNWHAFYFCMSNVKILQKLCQKYTLLQIVYMSGAFSLSSKALKTRIFVFSSKARVFNPLKTGGLRTFPVRSTTWWPWNSVPDLILKFPCCSLRWWELHLPPLPSQ